MAAIIRWYRYSGNLREIVRKESFASNAETIELIDEIRERSGGDAIDTSGKMNVQ
jgi:hypothetical protein